MKDRARIVAIAVVLAALAAVPPVAAAIDEPFYLDLVRRIMIFAIAALSLNLILGYGGMVSFGHAAYLGVGAYAVGILAHHGIDNGFLQFAAAIAASALIALVIGAISIRTSGVYFIMITLAFTQMLYYLGISIEEYGGDDGMRLAGAQPVRRPRPGEPDAVLLPRARDPRRVPLPGAPPRQLALRHGDPRGEVERGAHARHSASRPTRTGSPPSSSPARSAAVAGALLVNQTAYLTPEFMNWTRSGELMFMVILGGIATLIGPVLGAAALLLLEDLLRLDRSLADHPRADPGAGGAVRAARAGRPAARRGAR